MFKLSVNVLLPPALPMHKCSAFTGERGVNVKILKFNKPHTAAASSVLFQTRSRGLQAVAQCNVNGMNKLSQSCSGPLDVPFCNADALEDQSNTVHLHTCSFFFFPTSKQV